MREAAREPSARLCSSRREHVGAEQDVRPLLGESIARIVRIRLEVAYAQLPGGCGIRAIGGRQ